MLQSFQTTFFGVGIVVNSNGLGTRKGCPLGFGLQLEKELGEDSEIVKIYRHLDADLRERHFVIKLDSAAKKGQCAKCK